MKIKHKKGKNAKVLKLSCAQCEQHILTYLKNGKGGLLRCFLEGILAPEELVLSKEAIKALSKSELQNLRCQQCDILIGLSMTYKDGRLAYRLINGTYKKKQI